MKTICPLHGPVLTGDLSAYLEKYDVWSSYRPEERGVLIAYTSIYGNTASAALRLRDMLARRGEKRVAVVDLARGDISRAVADAFRYDALVLAASSYDGGVFPADGGFPFPPEGEKLAEAHRRRDRERKLGAVGREDDARGAGRDEGDRAACADRHHPFGRVAGDGRGAQHACGRAGCARITGRRLRQTLWKPKGRLAGV